MPAESGVENVRQASRLAARVIAHGGFELFSQSRHGFEAFDQIVFVCRDGHDLYNIGLSLLQKQGKLDDLFSFHGNAGMAAMTPYSSVWFRKVFREVTGMSPIRYIRTMKMCFYILAIFCIIKNTKLFTHRTYVDVIIQNIPSILILSPVLP